MLAATLPIASKADQVLVLAMVGRLKQPVYLTTRPEDTPLRSMTHALHLFGPHQLLSGLGMTPEFYSKNLRQRLNKLAPACVTAKWQERALWQVAMAQLTGSDGSDPVNMLIHGRYDDDGYATKLVKLADKLKIKRLDVTEKRDWIKKRLKADLVSLIGNKSIWTDQNSHEAQMRSDRDFLTPKQLLDQDVPW